MHHLNQGDGEMSLIDGAVQDVSVSVPRCEVGKVVPGSVRERVSQILADQEMAETICSVVESGKASGGFGDDETADTVQSARFWLDWHEAETEIGDLVHCLDAISCE